MLFIFPICNLKKYIKIKIKLEHLPDNMNLIHTIRRTMITLITIITLPNSKKQTLIKNIRKIASLFILIQTILLHIQIMHRKKNIVLLLTNNTIINNTILKINGFSLDNIRTSLLLLTSLLIITCILIREKTIYHTQKTLLICLFRTILTLFLTFTTSNIIFFYIMFERSIIPLIIIYRNMRIPKRKNTSNLLFFNIYNNRIPTLILNNINYTP